MSGGSKFFVFLCLTAVLAAVSAFHVHSPGTPKMVVIKASATLPKTVLFMSKDDGVVELADDEPTAETEKPKEEKVVAPFLSQGEVSNEPMDLSDPKQARVAIYIILSLLPVLFLIPLMLGSRDLIPPEMLPPVEM